MLTPTQVQQYKQKYGFGGTNSRTTSPEQKSGFLQNALSVVGSAAKGFGSIVSEGAEGVKKAVTETPGQPLRTGLRTAGAVAKTANRLIGEPIARGVEMAGEAIAGTETAQTIAETPEVSGVLDLINEGLSGIGSKYQEWAERNPDSAKDLESTTEIGLLLLGQQGVGKVANPARNIIGRTGKVLGGAGGAGGAASKAVSKAGKGLKELGVKSTGLTVTMEKPTAQMLQNYNAYKPTLMERVGGMMGKEVPENTMMKPTTEADTATRLGIYGTERQLGSQSKRIADDLWKGSVGPALKASPKKVDIVQWFDEIEDEILQTVKDPIRKSTLDKALTTIESEFDVGKKGWWTLEELQELKSEWTKFLPDASFKGKPISGAMNEVRNLMAKKARGVIYDDLGPDVKQSYIDWGNLQSIQEAGIKASIGDPASKSLSRNIWEGIMDKAITPVATVAGQFLYKTGEGLEFIGRGGAKKVRDIIDQPTLQIAPKVVPKSAPQSTSMFEKSEIINYLKENPPGLTIKDVSKLPKGSGAAIPKTAKESIFPYESSVDDLIKEVSNVRKPRLKDLMSQIEPHHLKKIKAVHIVNHKPNTTTYESLAQKLDELGYDGTAKRIRERDDGLGGFGSSIHGLNRNDEIFIIVDSGMDDTLVHELGHSIFNKELIRLKKEGLGNDFNLEQKIDYLRFKHDKNPVSKRIEKYMTSSSGRDIHEYAAELYRIAYNLNPDRAIPKEVVSYVRKYLKDNKMWGIVPIIIGVEENK